MLGWDNANNNYSLNSDLLDDTDGVATLIDHIHEPLKEQRLTWDGRKGQWIPICYSFKFPRTAFDHAEESSTGDIKVRKLASHSFPPSKRHTVMLDQGSPQLRVHPRTVLHGRKPCLLKGLPRFPLTNRMIKAEECETEDEEVKKEPVDPFNLDSRPVKPMLWLDDIDIEDFLSSAIDYQVDNNTVLDKIPMSEPIYSIGMKRRLPSPCTPSSPPPPLFRDDNNRPIPDFKTSPLRGKTQNPLL